MGDTITLHQYVECSPEHADRNRSRGKAAIHKLGTGVVEFVYAAHNGDGLSHVRYLGELVLPVAQKPKEIVTYKFQQVLTPEKDADGKCWYATAGGALGYFLRAPRRKANYTWLRRTVERSPAEPETWDGIAVVRREKDGQVCSRRSHPGELLYGEVTIGEHDLVLKGFSFPGREQAEADLELLRRLATLYATAHDAAILWGPGNSTAGDEL